MAQLSSQLILSLIDGVTGPSRAVTAAVGNMRDRIERNNQALMAAQSQMFGAAAAGYALYRGIAAPIRAAMQFESAMADIRKVVDFPTPDLFSQMGDDIIEMSKRLPMAATGIADIVAQAGQSGVARDELLPFAEIATKVAVAWDMAAGHTGEALAKIKTQLSLSVAETSVLADAINHLSNNSASAAPDLVEYMKRIASVGEMAGITAAQTAALGSAMIAAGAAPEVAATSFRNVVKMLSKGGEAADRQKAAFDELGLDAIDVAAAFGKDPTAALREVLVALSKIEDPAKQMTAAFGVFGEEARGFMPLIANIQLYDDALALVSQRADYLGSSQKEYEQRAKTAANAMKLFSNQVNALGIAIGEALLPGLIATMEAIAPLVEIITDFAKANPELTATVIGLTTAMVGLRIAAIAARFAFFWMRGAYLATALAGLMSLARGARILAAALFPLGAAARAARSAMIAFAAAASISGIASAAKIALATMGAAFFRFLNPVRMVTAALVALRTAFLLSGVGAAIVAVAAGGMWIFNNWQGVKELFAGIWEGFRNAAPAAAAAVSGIVSAIQDVVAWLGRITGPLDASMEEWRAWGRSIGEAIGSAVDAIVGPLTSALNGIKEIADSILATFETISTLLPKSPTEQVQEHRRAAIAQDTAAREAAVANVTGLPPDAAPSVAEDSVRRALEQAESFERLRAAYREDRSAENRDAAGAARRELAAAMSVLPEAIRQQVETFQRIVAEAGGRVTPEAQAIAQQATSPAGQPVAADPAQVQAEIAALDQLAAAVQRLGELRAEGMGRGGFREGYLDPTQRAEYADLTAQVQAATASLPDVQAKIDAFLKAASSGGDAAKAAMEAVRTAIEAAKAGLVSFQGEAANAASAAQTTGSTIQTSLNVTARPVVDTSSIDAAGAKVDSLVSKLSRLNAQSANVNAKVAATGQKIPGRAAGGPVSAGSLYQVGERGEELYLPKVLGAMGRSLFRPPTDGTIIPAHRTRGLLQGLRNAASPMMGGLGQVLQSLDARSGGDGGSKGLGALSGIFDALAERQEGAAMIGAFNAQPQMAAATAAPPSAPGSLGGVSVSFGDIRIEGGSSASADDLASAFGRQIHSSLRRAFSDGGF